MHPQASPHSPAALTVRRPLSSVVVAVNTWAPAERAVRLALSVSRDDVRTEFVFCHVINIPRMLARIEQEDYEIALHAAQDRARTLLDLCLVFAEDAGVF